MAESWQADYDLPLPPPESPSPHVAPQSRPSGTNEQFGKIWNPNLDSKFWNNKLIDKLTQWWIQRYDEEYSSADNFKVRTPCTTNDRTSKEEWELARQNWINLSDEEKYKQAKSCSILTVVIISGLILTIVIGCVLWSSGVISEDESEICPPEDQTGWFPCQP